MARPLPPFTFICPACGWRTTTLGSSDAVRMGKDMFLDCPRCRHKEIEQRRATAFETVCARASRIWRPKR